MIILVFFQSILHNIQLSRQFQESMFIFQLFSNGIELFPHFIVLEVN